jgi:hypothetical protein
MADPVEMDASAEPAAVDTPAPPPPSRKATGRKVTKPSSRRSSRRVSRATATVEVKVGDHAVAMPKSLAAQLTTKDKKRLLALFKRVLKRQKKQAQKKGAAKARAGKKRSGKKRAAKKR